MSADNWTDCPKCKSEAGEAGEAGNYQGETFREDYGIGGAEDGELHIDYSGECSECGLSLTFSRVVPFYPPPATEREVE